MKFRKKPVVIEAIQFDGNNALQVFEFTGDAAASSKHGSMSGLCIVTREGTMTASVGDWIIKGVKGEFYPCKPDIFEATYERVEE